MFHFLNILNKIYNINKYNKNIIIISYVLSNINICSLYIIYRFNIYNNLLLTIVTYM